MFLALATLAAALTLVGLPTERAAAAGCAEKQLYFVAHEDDDILFGSPDLLEAIEGGACVRTVFLTAGDAGRGETYWLGREAGSRAAYAYMAGVDDNWTASESVVEGHHLQVETLAPLPDLSQVNIRLPDGNMLGEGFPATGNQSLAKLWRGQNPEPASLTPISQMQTVDHSNIYTYASLLATMAALIAEYEPDVIATQDDQIGFGEGDHADHVVTARLARLAAAGYAAEHVFRSYVDYPTQFRPQNLFGTPLQAKSQAFYIYGAHDPETCASEAQCEMPPFQTYGAWLKRQYVADQISTPGADAGAAHSVPSEATVMLDGSGSSDPLGKSLTYEWQQTSGPAVTLSDRHAVKPTFKAPLGPAALEFELVVDNGEAPSLPATVTVTVAAPPPHRLTVTKGGDGSGSVSSSPAGIKCGASCSAEFSHGTVVTLTASPAAGSEFTGWSGACSGTAPCVVTMSAAKSVEAEFVLERHRLTVTKAGGGAGSVESSPAGIKCGSSCSAEFAHGTQVTLTASAATGSEFTGWSGACSGTAPCVVTMSTARTVEAGFALQRHRLTVTKGGNGSGAVESSPAGIECGSACAAEFDHGTVVTLTANAAAGSEFKGWSGACSGTGPCVVTMSTARSVEAEFSLQRHRLTVTKGGNGAGSVESSPAGIKCGSSCSAEFAHGTQVTLTASAATGSEFTGWSGACSGTAPCVVTMAAARSVEAGFSLRRHRLTVTKGGNGAGSVESSPAGIDCGAACAAEFDHGTQVTLMATATAGSEFKGWSGACLGTGPCVVTMSAAKSVEAEFVLERHRLTVTRTGGGSGTVTSSPTGINCGSSCAAEFDHGTQVTLTASAADGSEFTGWSGCDQVDGVGACVVTMSAARTVEAGFRLERHLLTVIKAGTGSGSVESSPAGIDCGSSCAAEFAHGTQVTLTAKLAAGSEFTGWSGACSGTAPCVVTMAAARSVEAGFSLQRHRLTVTKGGNGVGSVESSPAGIDCGSSCSAEFSHGAQVTLMANAATGSEFTGWSGACSGTGPCVVTMSAARSVEAGFALQRHRLTVTKASGGAGSIESSPAGIECGSSCSAEFAHGTQVTLTAKSADGSEFTGWSGACSGTGPCVVTMAAARSVEAGFALQRHRLTVTKAGGGAGSVESSPTGIDCGASCSAEFSHWTRVTLTADPAAGSEFTGWSGCDQVDDARSCLIAMTAEREVTATFDPRSLPPGPPGPEPTHDPIPTPGPTPAPTPEPPTAELIRAKVNHARGTATFAFKGAGAVRFQCALTGGHRKPRFKHCSSPTTYRHLRPGRYVFKVRAITISGRPARPLVRKFGIAARRVLKARSAHRHAIAQATVAAERL